MSGWRRQVQWTKQTSHRLRVLWRATNSPTRTIVLQATGMWLATRVLLALVTYFALTLSSFSTRQLSPHDLLESWNKFDTVWYLNISRYGYWTPTLATFARDHGQMPTAFFPLYPLLIAVVTLFIGTSHRLAAALLISNLGALAGFIGLGLFASQEEGHEASVRTIRLVAAYPMAFFLAAAYTEGIFLAFAIFCLYFLRRGSWYGAAICAFCATLTRFTGIVLLLPMIWEYGSVHSWWHRTFWEDGAWRRWLHRKELFEVASVVLSVPLGLGSYMLYLGLWFGEPLSFVRAEETGWLRSSMPLWQSLPLALRDLFTTPAWTYQQALILLDLIPLLAFGIITLLMIRRQPASFTLYMCGLLALIVVSPITWSPDLFASAGRFLIPAAPIFLLLARWSSRRPGLDLFLVGCFLLQGALLTLWLTTPAYIT